MVGIAGAARIVSPLGDYFGRRRVLLGSFALVATATLLAAHASTASELFTWRFLTGVGLGSSLPNALALTAEYAPSRSRTMLVGVMACGISVGAIDGGRNSDRSPVLAGDHSGAGLRGRRRTAAGCGQPVTDYCAVGLKTSEPNTFSPSCPA